MPRTTDQEVNEAVEEMVNDTRLPLRPYWAYGRVRLMIQGERKGYSDFSPTFDTNSDLMVWMEAFMQGWSMRGLSEKKTV